MTHQVARQGAPTGQVERCQLAPGDGEDRRGVATTRHQLEQGDNLGLVHPAAQPPQSPKVTNLAFNHIAEP